MSSGPALSATEDALIFSPFTVMVHRICVVPGRHHGRRSNASLRSKNVGSRWIVDLNCWGRGDFTNPRSSRRTDVLGGLRHRGLRPSWASIPVGPASRCTVFDCPLTCLRLDPFGGKLATQNIRKNSPRPDLRRGFGSRCCGRGGRPLLRKAALDQIAPLDGGLGGRLMAAGREQTFLTQALVRGAFGCDGCVRRLRSLTFYFDRKRRPCHLMAHLMYSSCKSVGI
jgi:hypothetical protein